MNLDVGGMAVSPTVAGAICRRLTMIDDRLIEAQWAVLDDRLERVALSHRDIVAADAVAVPKLIDTHKIGNRLVQVEGVAVERRLR
jgi:hypothetical protein